METTVNIDEDNFKKLLKLKTDNVSFSTILNEFIINNYKVETDNNIDKKRKIIKYYKFDNKIKNIINYQKNKQNISTSAFIDKVILQILKNQS